MLSVPELGKTPLAMALLMSLSRDSNDPDGPYFRVSSEMDFFRGEAGIFGRGDMFDDGDISAQAIKVLKAFLDVALLEAATWARWGGCRWAKGQPRLVLDNKLNLDAEVDGDGTQITHVQFLELIDPMFTKHNCTTADKEAVLKRANFVVQTKDWFLVREASADRVAVNRTRLAGKRDWIKASSKPKYNRFQEQDYTLPADWEDCLAWEGLGSMRRRAWDRSQPPAVRSTTKTDLYTWLVSVQMPRSPLCGEGSGCPRWLMWCMRCPRLVVLRREV